MKTLDERLALVTGASSGIGLITAQSLAKAGYRVFGTTRKTQFPAPGITMVACDVTSEASVASAVDAIVRQTGRIDLVVNNAGSGLLGAAEECTIAQAQDIFDINVFGVARVVNAVLPHMRKQRGGRIINVSSILGLIPSPFNAYYAATKHAIEGYSESLDHEVRGFGIRVVLVEPGVTRTSFEANLARAKRPLDVYNEARVRSEALMRQWVNDGDAPQVVADAVLKAATSARPSLRYPAGKQARQVRLFRRVLPQWLVDRMLHKVNGLTT
jgi:NAD(P)-dependent dehydrogenase (short-subunit alcohol dehydrogenase family)